MRADPLTLTSIFGRDVRYVVPMFQLLVESFPAGQLHHWNLPHEGYDGPDGKSARATILDAISPRIQIPGYLRTLCQDSADALDAVLCLFSAKVAA